MVHTYYSGHMHSHFSNNRFLDSMNTVADNSSSDSLIVNCKKKGLRGIAITDHGVLSGHVKVAKMMDAHPDFFNGKDGKGKFSVVLGEEIYLDDASIIEDAVKNNKKTKFFHFVLTAKDDIGYHALRIITSNSWKLKMEHVWDDNKEADGTPRPHAFFYRGMRRLPTYKDWLYKLMNDPHFGFKGHVIASTACLGSESSWCILHNDKPRLERFIKYICATFGKKQCYFEMMPALRPEQEKVNKTLWAISHGNGIGAGIPCIITTDSHYEDSSKRGAHSNFLKSENPSRDVSDFYYYAHTFTFDELKKYFPENVLQEAAKNSLDLLKRYAPIWHATNEDKMRKVTKEHPDNPPVRMHYIQEIPKSPIPNFKPIQLSDYPQINWNKYNYFAMFCNSKIPEDRYYMYKIFNGMKKRHIPLNDQYLSEINWELMTLRQKTKHFHAPMTAYFLTVFYAVIDTCWNADSLVGPGRGSAGEWVTNYILGITQVDSIKWHLWAPRFSSPQRNDMPDIDLDSESSRRLAIIALLRQKYGYDRVLNFSTFNTQAAKSTIYTCCRGYVYKDPKTGKTIRIGHVAAQNIANLLPADARGMGNISLHDALFGNKKNNISPAKPFIKAVHHYPGLQQDLLSVGGKIRGVGEHASGVALWNEPLTQRNAVMRTNKAPGICITQFSAHDSAYLSSLKYDILTLSALDRIHEALRLLIRDGKIKKFYDKDGKFSLHDTYLHYFGPQALDFTSPEMFEMLFHGDVTDAFEFNSIVGRKALHTVHAHSFSALVAANALMRLTVDTESNTPESRMMKKYWGREQPIDRYVRYMNNPGDWDKDMKKFGLNNKERQMLHQFLDRHCGVCYSQEDLMKIDMRICYGIKDFLKLSPNNKMSYKAYNSANTLRKAVAKKDPKILEQAREEFYNAGKARGVRRALLDYVWYNCAVPAKNYSFNLSHGVAYTIILIIEMNICYRFGPIYWQTACLSVNSGIYGGKNGEYKNADYTKLDSAMGQLQDKIINPNINVSQYGYIPYKNHILYGLYPIHGISKDDCDEIINNRPYKSFKDFLDKTDLSKKKNITLIKSGCFDSFTKNRTQLMLEFIKYEEPLRKRVTTTQIKKLYRNGRIPKQFISQANAYRFHSAMFGKRHLQMTDAIKDFYLSHYDQLVKKYINDDSVQVCGTKDGKFFVNQKPYDKWMRQYIKPLKAWLKTKDALIAEAAIRRNKLFQKYCIGNIYSWEMDALGCYITGHELSKAPELRYFHLSAYDQLPKVPTPVSVTRSKYNNRVYKNYNPVTICGTVIGKKATKALVYLLTPHGIANVRVGRWRYPKFNKKITKKTAARKHIQPKNSWFDRGTKLLCIGTRMDNNFILNSRRSPYNDCLYRIKGYGKHIRVVDVKGNAIDQDVINDQKVFEATDKQAKLDLKRSRAKLRKEQARKAQHKPKTICQQLNDKFAKAEHANTVKAYRTHYQK